MVSIVQLIAIFTVPLLILRQREKGLIKIFGTIGMAYFWGIAVALGVWLLNRFGVELTLNKDIGEIGSYVCIGLAIPLLMFGTDLKSIRSLTKTVLLSFASLIVSVCIVVLIIGRTLGDTLPWGPELCAMATGMYTGGSPNFNAIGMILKVDSGTIALGNLADMVVGTVFYLFILFAAKPLLRVLLDRRSKSASYMKDGLTAENMDTLVWSGFHRRLVRNLLISFGCVVLGAVIGLAIWLIRGRSGALTDPLVPAVMITGTVLGLAFSFIPSVREVKENAAAGHYLILVFSFALASSLRLSGLSISFLRIVLLLFIITVCSFALHTLLSRLLRIEADCTIVTMTAGIYGPAFIPAVTKQLKNDRLTAPGLICGALGYAVGTFLGVGLHWFL